MATRFKTINDVVEEYVRPALGGWAEFYDIVSIAYEITFYLTVRDDDYVHFDRSQRILKDVHDPESKFFDADMFWDICEHYRKGN